MAFRETLVAALTAACAMAASAATPLDAINTANPSIVEWEIIGACPMGGRLIRHWIPLAWTETSPAGQSFITGASSQPLEPTSVLRTSGLESSVAARVFSFSNPLWRASIIANSYQQQVCNISDAHASATPDPYPSGNCAAPSALRAALSSAFPLQGLLAESYSSNADPGWLSGCRDQARVDEAVDAQVRCDTEHLGPAMQPGGARAAAIAARNCLGRWGSLYPRQSRDIGLTGGAASAKAAYRAMSTARDHVGTLPYPVDTKGKMQMARPWISEGFRPGVKPLPSPADKAPQNKQFAWIYWRQVTCCAGSPGVR